ncbi:MAG: FAD-dependent oxidoreductase [Chloroflexi bacterium]|nr:FAD-dependent oxidoreductase [Chloroflexota bacterium]
MDERYDLVVVGAGSAGLAAARSASQLGARVALVERERIGGDCTWNGCVPSKTLIAAAGLAHQMREADRLGLSPANPKADLLSVLKQVRAASQGVSVRETPAVLSSQGVEVVGGEARFVEDHVLDVGGRRLNGRRIVLSTGAKAVVPPIPGLDSVPFSTYADIFSLNALPPRLLVLGAGPVGLELGQAFARLGSEVTLIDQSEHILQVADPEASEELRSALAAEGVRVVTGTIVERVQACNGQIELVAPGGSYVGDSLLVATGRRPRVEGLGLDQTGVAYNDRGIEVDRWLRTTRSHIYACGDVAGSPQFSHYAGWQGFVAARNALLPGRMPGSALTPWAVFTDPEVAQVGLTEQQARAQHPDLLIERWPLDQVDRAHTMGDERGFLKLIARADGTLLGATILARHASEIANELAVAIRCRLRFSDLAQTIHVYPTYGFAIQEMSADATLRSFATDWRGALARRLVGWWPR